MSPAAIGLALFAAVLHASWNALLRGGRDRLWTATLMSVPGAILALPVAIMAGALPSPSAWAFIIASAGLQLAYTALLAAAYERGDFGQTYPIIRGSVPLLVMLGGLTIAGRTLTPGQIAGVMMVTLGIGALAIGKARSSLANLLLAAATGLIIAAYATVDSIGVTKVATSSVYAAWVLILFGIFQPVAFLAIRRRTPANLWSTQTITGLAGGVIAMMAYGAIIIAYSLAPAGPIVAIRETSIVFAVGIGTLFFGEKITLRRGVACCVIVAGIATLSL